MADQYRHTDTKLADGLHIQWARIIVPDMNNDKPDEHDDGFWPSRDPKAAGYIGDKSKAEFVAEYKRQSDRMAAWERGDWCYVGVVAEARCLIVRNGHGTFYTLRSPGLWGIESDAGEYLDEVFSAQKVELLADLKMLYSEPVTQSEVDG